MGAKCAACEQDMMVADGCTEHKIWIGPCRKMFDPIKWGAEGDLWPSEPGERCHDCNAKQGFHHHPGCDVERCPVCHGQLISCGCLTEEMVL